MSKKSFVGGLNSLLQESADRIKNDGSLQESNKPIKLVNNKAIKPASGIAVSLSSNKTSKEKATFNLSKQLLQELEDAWIKIRKARGDKKVSKTDIVEFSLNQMLTDFKTIKQESMLYGYMASNKENF